MEASAARVLEISVSKNTRECGRAATSGRAHRSRGPPSASMTLGVAGVLPADQCATVTLDGDTGRGLSHAASRARHRPTAECPVRRRPLKKSIPATGIRSPLNRDVHTSVLRASATSSKEIGCGETGLAIGARTFSVVSSNASTFALSSDVTDVGWHGLGVDRPCAVR
jgi:hypothetical protein